jgi:hypothetical protein
VTTRRSVIVRLANMLSLMSGVQQASGQQHVVDQLALLAWQRQRCRMLWPNITLCFAVGVASPGTPSLPMAKARLKSIAVAATTADSAGWSAG